MSTEALSAASQHSLTVFLIFLLLHPIAIRNPLNDLLVNPLQPTSTANSLTTQPFAIISFFRSSYFASFLSCAHSAFSSHGHVSSHRMMVFVFLLPIHHKIRAKRSDGNISRHYQLWVQITNHTPVVSSSEHRWPATSFPLRRTGISAPEEFNGIIPQLVWNFIVFLTYTLTYHCYTP